MEEAPGPLTLVGWMSTDTLGVTSSVRSLWSKPAFTLFVLFNGPGTAEAW